MTAEQLSEVLAKHKRWINGEKDGEKANLRGADLTKADLTGAHLRGANLARANLTGAYLRGTNLTRANLTGADLRETNLRGANLTGADLTRADLTGAYLTGADLRETNLRGANLTRADLTRADLTGAYLTGADLRETKALVPLACPEEGAFIAFKRAAEGAIIKLRIPEDAKRLSATTRKCRCDKAIVLSIENADGTPYEEKSVYSCYDKDFVYTVGQEVYVPDFDDNRWNECSAGIHFFVTREEAVQYCL